MTKLLINDITMKFNETLTKTERDISKNWDFANNPHPISMTECQVEKHIDLIHSHTTTPFDVTGKHAF